MVKNSRPLCHQVKTDLTHEQHRYVEWLRAKLNKSLSATMRHIIGQMIESDSEYKLWLMKQDAE